MADFKLSLICLATAAALSACGGSDDDAPIAQNDPVTTGTQTQPPSDPSPTVEQPKPQTGENQTGAEKQFDEYGNQRSGIYGCSVRTAEEGWFHDWYPEANSREDCNRVQDSYNQHTQNILFTWEEKCIVPEAYSKNYYIPCGYEDPYNEY